MNPPDTAAAWTKESSLACLHGLVCDAMNRRDSFISSATGHSSIATRPLPTILALVRFLQPGRRPIPAGRSQILGAAKCFGNATCVGWDGVCTSSDSDKGGQVNLHLLAPQVIKTDRDLSEIPTLLSADIS